MNKAKKILLSLIPIVIIAGLLVWRLVFFEDEQEVEVSARDIVETTDGLQKPEVTENGNSKPEEATDPDVTTVEDKKSYSYILSDMLDCLDIKAEAPADTSEINLKTMLSLIEPVMGDSQNIVRWKNWHFKHKSGNDGRLRLEVFQDEEGKLVRETQKFSVDAEGLPVPEETKHNRLSDSEIEKYLATKQVFYTEIAGTRVFKNKDRLE